MKIDVSEHGHIRLREVFSGVLLETECGNQIGICMRDDTLEINVMPHGVHTDNWWRVDMQKGEMQAMQPTCPKDDQAQQGHPARDGQGFEPNHIRASRS